MLEITARKGIITRPLFEKDRMFPLIKCDKCTMAILSYPFFKKGYEKYYHITCAFNTALISIEEIEQIIKKLEITSEIALETKYHLELEMGEQIKRAIQIQ